MSTFNPTGPADQSGRSQRERRQDQLLSDLAKGLDVQHHNTSLMHEFGSAFDAPQTVSSGTSGTGTVGSAPSPARSDHQHGPEVPTFIYPTLLNSWVNYLGTFQVARYYKMNGMVIVEGLVKSGTMGSPIFNLQTGYRPPAALMWATIASNALGRINVPANGDIYFEAAIGTNGYVSLNCAFYPG